MSEQPAGSPSERRSVRFCTDRDLADEAVEVNALYEFALRERDWIPNDLEVAVRFDEAKARLDTIEAAVSERSITFVFEPVDLETFERLKSQHPATDAQKADARMRGAPPPDYDARTFAPSLVAAACVEVQTPSGTQLGLSIEDAKTIWTSSTWNRSERHDLLSAASAVYGTRSRMVVVAAERLAGDVEYSAVVDYCAPRGIRVSEFLKWSLEDQAAALAWRQWNARRCPTCNQHPDDWTDEHGVELADPPFEVIDYFCGACELLEEAREDGKPRAGYHKAFRRVPLGPVADGV